MPRFFRNRPLVRFAEEGHVEGEDAYLALGTTGAGRHLMVFFICKRDGRALVISARVTDREKRRYRRGR